ncbi:MAG TPA: glycosyltransferase family 4 protein [Myxococcota bacterium]|nr:glycosyltransferase family 4 protein [Myxococcota bacterium]
MSAGPRIAYLFARYPVPSQTFCDTEMLALEALGLDLEIDATSPPKLTLRHERLAKLRAELHLLPPPRIVRVHALRAEREGRFPSALVAAYDGRYGRDAGGRTLARQALALAPGLERRGVAHVHAHFASHAAKVALFLKRVAGFPFSLTAHAQDFMVDLGSDDLLRELVGEAEFTVAVSDWSRDRLRAICPDAAERIVRVYNGIDPAEFPEQALHAPTSRPRILSVARLIEFKGFHHLIDACAELRRRGLEFACTIVGEGPWRGELEQRIRRHRLETTVELAGLRTQDEVKRLLLASDVFALASIVDSKGACDVLPTVILEAMASGLPVVSTRLAGVPELVEDGMTGLLAEPGDPASLADALERALRDRELRRSFGEAGRKRLEERFASARSAPALYDRFLASAARSPHRARGAKPRPAFAVFLDRWPARAGGALDAELRALAAGHPEVPVFVGALDERFDPTDRRADTALAAHLEFLPDGIVLEAAWLADAPARAAVDALRGRVPTFFSGEDYYREARRALWVAGVLRRRGIGRLHAARAASLLCAWLVKQLAPDVHVSFALERAGTASRRASARLCGDLDLGAVSDDLLFETVRAECGEALPLVTPLPLPPGAPLALPPLRPLRAWLRPARGPNLERDVPFDVWLERLAGRSGGAPRP